jgi:hypothetical protein
MSSALIHDPLWRRRVWKNLANASNQFAASVNRRFEFDKRRQLFVRVHNETLSVVTVRVSNEDCLPVG